MTLLFRRLALAVISVSLVACGSRDDISDEQATVVPILDNVISIPEDAEATERTGVETTSTPMDSDTAIDSDGDGVSDSDDPYPYASSILDSDADGLSDETEVHLGLHPLIPDTDNDGIIDGMDRSPGSSSIMDTDMDALFDSNEENAGLDPLNPDTDGDGILDGEDRFPNASLILDSDNDGLFDSEEENAGLDPFNPDTDDDGMLDGVDRFPNASSILDSNVNQFDGTEIRGRFVASASQQPIANAKISLDLLNKNTETNPLVVTTTNSNGEYTLVAEASLIPDSFIAVVSADGYVQTATVLVRTGNTVGDYNVELELLNDSYITVETGPTVHHLGDDSFGGSPSSQLQRATEGSSLNRNFNITADQLSLNFIELVWVAKSIERPNTISI